MKKWLFAFSMAGLLALTGCSRPAPEEETSPAETETVEEAPVEEETSGIKVIENVGPDKNLSLIHISWSSFFMTPRQGFWPEI